jgi:hypothetical protein
VKRIFPGLLCALVLLFAVSATAHEGGTTGYAAITVSGRTVRYTLTLSSIPPSPLAEEMGFGRPGAAPEYGRLCGAIAEKTHLTNNGEACQAGPRHVIPPTPTVLSVTGIVDFVCPGKMAELAIRDDLFDVLGSDLHTLAKIEWPGGMQQFVFSTESREMRLTIAGKEQSVRGANGFFRLGIETILTGCDHLLFLLALILCSGRWIQVVKIITGFTVAFSFTLGLGALDLIILPGRLVDALIALSIACVAAQNLFPHFVISRRWMVGSVFGLVHGLGFARVLTTIGPAPAEIPFAILLYNIGIETGLIAFVVLILLLERSFRVLEIHWPWSGQSNRKRDSIKANIEEKTLIRTE